MPLIIRKSVESAEDLWVCGNMKTFLIFIVIFGELLGWSNAQTAVDNFSRQFLGTPLFAESNIANAEVSPQQDSKVEPLQTFSLGQIFKDPQKSPNSQNPQISAISAILLDINSGKILFEQNADEVRPIASIVKIITALVVLDNVKKDQTLVISGIGLSVAEAGSNIWFETGEELKVLDVVKAMLIASGNDAAYELANFYGGGDVARFVEMMNQKVADLGFKSMRFSDPAGIESGDIASARDLANLGRILLRKPELADFVSKPQSEIVSVDGQNRHELKTTNELLKDSSMHIFGIKTGTTDEAGQCLLAAAERDGHKLISVVLNSPDRFSETRTIINWGFDNFIWP